MNSNTSMSKKIGSLTFDNPKRPVPPALFTGKQGDKLFLQRLMRVFMLYIRVSTFGENYIRTVLELTERWLKLC